MRFLSLKPIPELFELTDLPPKVQWKVWRGAVFRMFRHWQFWLVIVAGQLLVFLLTILGGLIGQGFLGSVVGIAASLMVLSYVVFDVLLPPLVRARRSEEKLEPR